MEIQQQEKAMRVLIAYEDITAGKRAMALLERVRAQAGGSGRLKHMMWRFDLISDASFFEAAVNEALISDIVVIAADEGRELPQAVRDWIVRWLLKKADRPSALVATLDYSYSLTNMNYQESVRTYLSNLASSGRMQFFTNGDAGNARLPRESVKTDHWNWDAALARRDLLE